MTFFICFITIFNFIFFQVIVNSITSSRFTLLQKFLADLIFLSGISVFIIGLGLTSMLVDANFTVLCFFIFGVSTIIFFCIQLGQIINMPTSWQFYLYAIGAIAGAYIVTTTADHFWFVRGSSDQSGVVNLAELRIHDVSCENNRVLVRIEKNFARVRCPTFIVWGQSKNNLFIPWPSYHEGRSVELKQMAEKIKNIFIEKNAMI